MSKLLTVQNCVLSYKAYTQETCNCMKEKMKKENLRMLNKLTILY